MSTSQASGQRHNILVMGIHGTAKTTQARHMKTAYGPGFIVSGEAGLKSLKDLDIDYLPFQTWDGPVDPAQGIYSFKAVMKIMQSPAFKAKGYKWIMLDSSTELSYVLDDHFEKHPDLWKDAKGRPNNFDRWDQYNREMIGALKWFRDMPYHVIVTSLAKEVMGASGRPEFWPMMKGQAAGREVAGIFDFIFGLVKTTGENGKIKRLIVTDEINGWKCKHRTDPSKPLEPYYEGADITQLLRYLEMSPEAWAAYVDAMQKVAT